MDSRLWQSIYFRDRARGEAPHRLPERLPLLERNDLKSDFSKTCGASERPPTDMPDRFPSESLVHAPVAASGPLRSLASGDRRQICRRTLRASQVLPAR